MCISRAVKAENTAGIWLFTVPLPGGGITSLITQHSLGMRVGDEYSSVSEPREEEKEALKKLEWGKHSNSFHSCSLNTLVPYNHNTTNVPFHRWVN